jgi:hypothetical protein
MDEKGIALLIVYNISVITNFILLTGIMLLIEIIAAGHAITKAIKVRNDDSALTKIINRYKRRMFLVIPLYVALSFYITYITKVS